MTPRRIAFDFDVSYETISHIPTLSQAGYGCGILLISPLGDLVRRRQLVLLLMFLTTTLSVGMAMAKNVMMLEALGFVIGLFTVIHLASDQIELADDQGKLQVTPQICLPWTADLAPSDRRARAMSITLSGLVFGLVFGRVLAGVISNFASWRDTFWLAVGLQGGMCRRLMEACS